MKSVNKVILLGNITRDPECKTTANGQSVCTFGLATNRVWKDANGQKQSLPEYHNLVCWGGLAEFCKQNVHKGKPVYIEGYLKTRSWDAAPGSAPEGTKIFRTEIVVDNLVLLGAREATPFATDIPQEVHEDPAPVPKSSLMMDDEMLPSTESLVMESLDSDF